jgi:hypothetical protein
MKLRVQVGKYLTKGLDIPAGMHNRDILVKFRPEEVILDTMNDPHKSVRPPDRQSSSLRPKMGMVVCPVIKVIDAINLGDDSKKATHPFLPFLDQDVL